MNKSLASLLWVIVLVAGLRTAPAQPTNLLSLKQAQEIAIKQHPRITAAELTALASKQALRQARSHFYPTITANATGVDTADNNNTDNTHLAAGSLGASSVYARNAEGIDVTQLIYDFGRTANLASSSRLQSEAEAQNSLATRAQILLEVNAAFFDALSAQSVVEVARQTVATRQLLFDRVSELAKNQLRSSLDVSFAQVDLQSGKLLLSNARNDLQSSFLRLANLLADRADFHYRLLEEPLPSAADLDDSQLVQTALRERPDLARLRYTREAAGKFALAEKDLNYPTINALASGGVIPNHGPQLHHDYGAVGVNISLPIFDGFLYSAREKEAELRASAATELLRDAENNVIRDVRVASLNLQYAAEQMDLTRQLLASADQSFELAQARYNAGSSSAVELSQAQLNQTQARIGNARAKYEYQTRNSILNFQLGQLR